MSILDMGRPTTLQMRPSWVDPWPGWQAGETLVFTCPKRALSGRPAGARNTPPGLTVSLLTATKLRMG